MNTNANGEYVGLRGDDGTDNNYIECVYRFNSTTGLIELVIRRRLGGGSVTEVVNMSNSMIFPYSWIAIQFVSFGTYPTNYSSGGWIDANGTFRGAGSTVTGNNFSISRVGYIHQSTNSSFRWGAIDAWME